MLKMSHITLALIAVATLAACGGGSNTSNTTQQATLATAAYAGTWKNLTDVCELSDVKVANATGANLREDYFYTFTPLTDTSVSAVATLKLFAPTDTTCAGAVVATRTLSPFTFNFTGTAPFNGQVFDKFQVSPSSLTTTSFVLGGFTASNSNLGSSATTINGYYFPAGYFDPEPQTGALGYLRATSTNLFCDNDTGTLTAYPTGVDTAPCFVKM
jgi:hypothetical protein